MNPNQSNQLRQKQADRGHLSTDLGQNQQAAAQEFATAEDLLRHDSEAHPVPPELAHRLNRSIAAEPKPARSWFKSLFR